MILIIWTIASVIGAVVAGWNLWDSWKDLQALEGLQNGRHLVARGWVRREVVRFGIQVVWALVGIFALPTADLSNMTASIYAVLLVATNLAVMVNTVFDAYERINLRRIVNARR